MNRLAHALLALPLLFGATALHAQSAVDERAIISAASALDDAIDAKDWPRVRALLLDEVTVALPGEEPATLAADALVTRWQEALHPGKTTFHLRGSERVIFDGADSAVLHSKAQVWQRVIGIGGDDLYELWADYHHELDRTEDGWRIRHYGLVPRLERGNLAVLTHRLPPAPDEAPTAETPPTDDGTARPDGATAQDGTGDASSPPSDGG